MSPATNLAPQTRALILPKRQAKGHLAGSHHVQIYALTIQAHINVLLDEPGAKLTGGFGNWESVPVPRGVPFAQWTGRSLYTMDVALLIDGWHHQRSVEPEISKLEQMADRPGSQATPPPVRLVGAVPHAWRTWVITGLDWGDALRRFKTGVRLRQGVTVHLLEYQDASTVSALPPAPRKHRVTKDDDCKKLAARYLGKSSRWPDIVALNKGLRGWQLGSKWTGKTILIPAS
jgi:hypothetical protein